MADLKSIQSFIQCICEGITIAIEIDTQVIDSGSHRIAGTVNRPIPQNGGVVRGVIQKGCVAVSAEPYSSPSCETCNLRDECLEKGFIHSPITYKGEVVGVMGLICYRQEQIDRIKKGITGILNFVKAMCDLIELKLNEYEISKKEQILLQRIENENKVLNQILDQSSDGCILLDQSFLIRTINNKARKILHCDVPPIGVRIDSLIPGLNIENDLANLKENSYMRTEIRKSSYGISISPIVNKNDSVGMLLSFESNNTAGKRISLQYSNSVINFDSIIGTSEELKAAKELALRVAPSDPNVLLLGESGTGKEVFARAIHDASKRRNMSFVPINCAAIPLELFESELFGYEPGAFTGASKNGKIGKFELANHGTLFLDEIGEMPKFLQAKLLRVLQDRKIERLGSVESIPVDVRIIAATNKDLEKRVEEGKFREDLYYRLSVIPIHLPALRERTGDIPILAKYFVKKYQRFYHKEISEIAPDVLRCFADYPWRGNIRELENVIQYALSVCEGNVLDYASIPAKVKMPQGSKESNRTLHTTKLTREKEQIGRLLKKYGNTTDGKRKAARELGISLATLYRRLG